MHLPSVLLLASLAATASAPALAGPAPMVPAVGDTFTYALSTGEQVTLKTVRVRVEGDRTIALDQETIRKSGMPDREGALDVIRTDDALAFGFPGGDGSGLTPLVFFFSQATLHDSWLAQRESAAGSNGDDAAYQVLAQVQDIETVSSPAGTFAGCWRVVFSNSQDRSRRLTLWLRPDMGIIRTKSDYQGQTIVTELTGFSHRNDAGRPYP